MNTLNWDFARRCCFVVSKLVATATRPVSYALLIISSVKDPLKKIIHNKLGLCMSALLCCFKTAGNCWQLLATAGNCWQLLPGLQ